MACFSLQVRNLNDAPSDIILSTYTVKEDLLPGSTVASLSTVDADYGQKHVYTLLDNAGEDLVPQTIVFVIFCIIFSNGSSQHLYMQILDFSFERDMASA